MTNEEIEARVIAKISGKMKSLKPTQDFICALCGATSWSVSPGYFTISLSDDPMTITLGGGRAVPTVVVTCKNCGNTHLVSLLALGFTEAELATLKREA